MASVNKSISKLRMGMIGGGPGAFIGAVHRTAAALDGEIELVCGVFSSQPEKSRAMGKELGLPVDRVYDNYQEMIEHEKKNGGNHLCVINEQSHPIVSFQEWISFLLLLQIIFILNRRSLLFVLVLM